MKKAYPIPLQCEVRALSTPQQFELSLSGIAPSPTPWRHYGLLIDLGLNGESFSRGTGRDPFKSSVKILLASEHLPSRMKLLSWRYETPSNKRKFKSSESFWIVMKIQTDSPIVQGNIEYYVWSSDGHGYQNRQSLPFKAREDNEWATGMTQRRNGDILTVRIEFRYPGVDIEHRFFPDYFGLGDFKFGNEALQGVGNDQYGGTGYTHPTNPSWDWVQLKPNPSPRPPTQALRPRISRQT
jgi:hypothetical protein